MFSRFLTAASSLVLGLVILLLAGCASSERPPADHVHPQSLSTRSSNSPAWSDPARIWTGNYGGAAHSEW